MTLKRTLAIIFALVIIMGITGCGAYNSNPTDNSKSLTEVSTGSFSMRFNQYVVYDPETLVMYLYAHDYVNGGSTATVLYNADGSLRTYDTSTKISSLIQVSTGSFSKRFNQYVVYDPETLVMYLYTHDYVNGGDTATVLYNADGSLRTYDTSTKISSLIQVSTGSFSMRFNQYSVYDPETLVMYLYTHDYVNGGSTATVLYNADKSLKLNK